MKRIFFKPVIFLLASIMEYDLAFAILRRPHFEADIAWKAISALQDCFDLAGDERWRALVNERHPEIINALEDGLFVTSIVNATPSLFTRAYIPSGKLKDEIPVDAICPLIRYLVRASYRGVPYAGFSGASYASVIIADHQCALEYGKGLHEIEATIAYELYSGTTEMIYQSCPESVNNFDLNPTLYKVADRWNLYRQLPCSKTGRYVVESIVNTQELSALHEYMSRVPGGYERKELIDLLNRVSPEGIESGSDFIDTLLQKGFITSKMEFPCTVDHLNSRLIFNVMEVAGVCNHDAANYFLRNSRVAVDAVNFDWYRNLDACARSIFSSPPDNDVKSSLVLDSILPSATINISSESKRDLLKAAKLYSLIGSEWDSSFDEFVSLFFRRYGYESIPLPIAIDEHYGVSYGPIREPDTSITSGIRQSVSLNGGRESAQGILEKIDRAITAHGKSESKDLSDLLDGWADHVDLPDTFYCLAEFLQDERNENYVNVINFGGPSALRLAARFSKSNIKIRDALRSFSAKESELNEEIVLADVVFRAGDRLPNVQVHPSVRNYEILISGSSSCSPENTIYLSELHLKFSGGQLRLYCPRLNREIVPRMSSAYNPNYRGIPAYKFLAELATNRAPRMIGLTRSYDRNGPKMYPRITCGTVIIERKAWKVRHTEFFGTEGCVEDADYTPVSELPRRVEFIYGDLCFPVHVDNKNSRDLISRFVKGKDYFYLRECMKVSNGPYRHEIILPFIARGKNESESGDKKSSNAAEFAERPSSANLIHEGYAYSRWPAQYKNPGKLLDSGWFSMHVFIPKIHMNRFLVEIIVTRLKEGRLAGMIISYYFLRYSEGGNHLRLRFRLKDGCIGSFVELFTSEIKNSRDAYGIWDIKIETYYPEYERYGGRIGVAAAEAVFFSDSKLALRLLSNDEYFVSDAMKWKVAIFVMATYWDMSGLSVAEKVTTLRGVADSRVGFTQSKYVYDQKYRQHRADLKLVLSDCEGGVGRDLTALLFEWRIELRTIFSEIEAQVQSGRIRRSTVELIISYVHMSMNRLNEYKQNISEDVLYHMLTRHLYSELKRDG